MPPEDRVRLLHMLDACAAVSRFLAGRTREDLDTDEMLLFALVRAVEIFGEAGARVSEPTRATLPQVPWAQMTGMRNRLAHAYFDVDRDVLWRTATSDIPALASTLSAARDDLA